jgi:hypothetical protein
MSTDGGDLERDASRPAAEAMAYRTALRLGFDRPGPRRRLRTFGLLFAVTCVPLLLLTLPAGLAAGHRVAMPLLRDPSFFCRYFLALPLLVFADVIVARSLAVQMGYFLESGLIPETEHTRYHAAEAELGRLYHSRVAQGAMVLLSYAVVIAARMIVGHSPGSSSWERLGVRDGGDITAAGWWSILVALPIVLFLLLRWIWRMGAWAWFLYRASRLELVLVPTHPDRAGGLGFLTWGQAGFAPIVAGVSSVISGSLAAEVLYAGASLDSLKYHVVVFIALALGWTLAPLLVFSGKLARCRFQAALDFRALTWRHDRAFDEKWIRRPGPQQEDLLGSPDASSLADIAEAFEHVERMRLVPLDHQPLIVLFLAAVIPLLPFVASTIPLTEILKDLGIFMV